MTTLFRSQTLAFLPNSRLKTPIVPGPQTSCVISTSAFTQMLSPACTRFWPAARARIFSVKVIKRSQKLNGAAHELQQGNRSFQQFIMTKIRSEGRWERRRLAGEFAVLAAGNAPAR